MYITVASYDDLECEVSHVLYFMTTDCQTNTVKALLIIKLLKGQFTSQDITFFFFFFYELRVICKYTILHCLVLYTVFQFEAEICSLSSTITKLCWLAVNEKVLSIKVNNDSIYPNKHSTTFDKLQQEYL